MMSPHWAVGGEFCKDRRCVAAGQVPPCQGLVAACAVVGGSETAPNGGLAGSAGFVAMSQVVPGSLRRRSRLGPVVVRSVPMRRPDLRRPAGGCAGGLAASRLASARA